MKLLFVENHGLFARIVVGQFLGTHDVTVVASVAGALRILSEQAFDAVLVDYDLDDGKGSDVVRALRARDAATPVVAVSAREEGNTELIHAGASAVCSKLRFSTIGDVLERLRARAT